MSEELIITRVLETEEYYDISTEQGTCFVLDKKYKVRPKKGDKVTLHCIRWSKIRGMDINGKRIFYKSDEQLDKEHEEWCRKYRKEKIQNFLKNKKSLDDDYSNLPGVFKRRIDKFRKNNPDFRVNYESYEMLCCKEAIKIASCFNTHKELENYEGCLFKKCSLDDGHSGNTYNCSKFLAYVYLKEPEKLKDVPGALAPLVGSKEYGG